jgi:hypothetical protein
VSAGMDSDLLKCNRMTCRRALIDKAVVVSVFKHKFLFDPLIRAGNRQLVSHFVSSLEHICTLDCPSFKVLIFSVVRGSG